MISRQIPLFDDFLQITTYYLYNVKFPLKDQNTVYPQYFDLSTELNLFNLPSLT
jgi:hypothetical protein